MSVSRDAAPHLRRGVAPRQIGLVASAALHADRLRRAEGPSGDTMQLDAVAEAVERDRRLEAVST